jgi:hypothetical protein
MQVALAIQAINGHGQGDEQPDHQQAVRMMVAKMLQAIIILGLASHDVRMLNSRSVAVMV